MNFIDLDLIVYAIIVLNSYVYVRLWLHKRLWDRNNRQLAKYLDYERSRTPEELDLSLATLDQIKKEVTRRGDVRMMLVAWKVDGHPNCRIDILQSNDCCKHAAGDILYEAIRYVHEGS